MGEFIRNLQEQISRIWDNLTLQQRAIFVGAPALVVIMLAVAVYLAARPEMVDLVSSNDSAYIAQIRTALEQQNIDFETPDERTIQVNKSDLPKARIDLAQEGVIGPQEGPGYSLFATTRLGMTDRLFDVMKKQALEEELATTIRIGTNYDRVRVTLTLPEWTLFKEDEVKPTASVKIHSRRPPSTTEVQGIQNLVANAVPHMQPENVAVFDSNNKKLAGQEEAADDDMGLASTQEDLKRRKERDIYNKIHEILGPWYGADSFQVVVNLGLDWEKEVVEENEIDPDSQALLSSKIYEEESKDAAIAGEPGVDSNVQDTGIGAEGGGTLGTTINDTINNFTYSKTNRKITREIGEITSYHISILVDHVYDYTQKDYVPRPQVDLDKIKDLVVDGLGMQINPDATTGNIRDTIKVDTALFDRTTERELSRQQRYALVQRILLQYILPVIVLAAVFWLLFKYVQKAFAPKPIEEEPVEEVPIEPVTESRELTLAQLGLAEFGDIASLPAEEQRRLKMQEHVIRYAQEKPEEVAGIIKAWLTA